MGVEGPIFCRQKINYIPQYDISQLRPAGKTIQMIQNERQLVRIEVDQVESEKRIDIVRSDGKIVDFWSDDEAKVAVFAVLQNGLNQTLYLPEGATRPKLLKEMKTKSVLSVAWISQFQMLFGTSEGEVILCQVESTESYFGGSLGHSIKVLHQMDQAVSGLVTCTVSSTRTGTNRVILASGSSQLAHFIGPADDLTAIFSGYTPGSNVISFPGNSASKLVLAPQLNKESRVFAWSCMSGAELFVGEIKQSADRHQTITNNKIITGHGQSLVSSISLSKLEVAKCSYIYILQFL